MDEDERRLPSPKRPSWSRRLFTTDREKTFRTRRADIASTASISSTQLVLPDGAPDEDFVATDPDVTLRRRTLYQNTGPPFAEPRSQPSQSKPFELGFEDLCCYDAAKPHPKISTTFRKPPATPRSRNTPPELAADMGDAACLVALSSQRRHKNSSYTTLRSRDGESLGSRTQGGGTSRTRTDAPEEEPSVEVTWRREIRPIEGQHSSGKQAMPVLARQKKSPIPPGEHDAPERVPLSVASTSTRKPPAASEKEGATARPADKRQGLKIDISFGKSPGPDKDGKLLKSISTNVEKIVARLLSRCGEDRQPLSGVDDSETSVIELDSQRCVSVDVTIADDVGDRRQPWTSPVKVSHGQTASRAMLTARPHDATATPSGRTTAERPRRDGPRRAPTPTSIVHLTVGPIHFGHSQPGLQAISEPEGGRKAERWKTPAERLPTEKTTSRTPREITTGQRMRRTAEKRLPQAQASTGEQVRAIEEQHLTPEPVSYPESKLKPSKQSDLTSLRAVHKYDVTKSDAESVGKPGLVPAGKTSQEGLPSVHEITPDTGEPRPVRKKSISGKKPMAAAPPKEIPMKSPVSSQETELEQETKEAKPAKKADAKRKLSSADKVKLPGLTKKDAESVRKPEPVPARKPSLERLPSVHEITPDTGETRPVRKKSISGKKPMAAAPPKESPTKSLVSSQETELEQETKEAKPAKKADAKRKLSSADKVKLPGLTKKDAESVRKPEPVSARKPSLERLPSVHELTPDTGEIRPVRKKSISGKKPMAVASPKEIPMKSPVSSQETELEQETKRTNPAQKADAKSDMSSLDKGSLPAGLKKSGAEKKRATAPEKHGSLKSPASPEEALAQKAKRAKPVDETLWESKLSSPESGKLPSKRKKSVADKKGATRASAKDRLKGVPGSPEEALVKAAAPQSLVSEKSESSGDSKKAMNVTEKGPPAAPISLEVSGKPSAIDAPKPEQAVPEDSGGGGKKGPLPERTDEAPSKTDIPSKRSEKEVLSSPKEKKPSSGELPARDDKAESAEPEGANSSTETKKEPKKAGTSSRKESVRGDQETTKMLSEEMVSLTSDQQTEKTRTQDTSLHSILKGHRHTKDDSKKQGTTTKDGPGAAAETQEKRSKASEGSKTPSGSGTKLSSPRDVSPTEPEISGKGSSLIKQPSKRITADEQEGPTKELPKQGADSDGVTGSMTAKTVESETGETASKTIRTRELGEIKDPDASAIERAQKQSLVRKERSEMGEKDLDDFRVGFELALSPYRVLVGLQPARPSSEDEEGTTKKGAKLPKGRKYKNRRLSIVRIQKSDIERKRKKGQIDTPSLMPQAAESGDRAPNADRKKKRRRGKKSRGASQPPKKTRKIATSTKEPSAVTASASAATREGKTSGAPDGSQLEPALKEKRSARDSRRPSSDEPTSLRELEEEEEEEAKREKEKRKKKKRVKERKKKKRKKRKKRKHKKKRDRPIGYRSGNASCRVLCPVAIGLVFSVILLFMLLRALGYASPATFTASTVQPTFTFPALPTTTTTARTIPLPVPPPLPPVPPPVVPTAKPTPVQPPQTPPTKNVYVCPTETCKREGAYIATLLKSNSKPCDDLLDYVCDSWSRDHPVNPAGFGSFVSRGTLIQDALQRELLNIIRSAPDEDFRVVAGLHESCAKRPPRESPLKFWTEMFKTWVIRTWPANPNAQTSDVWQFAAELLRDLGFSTLLAVTVGVGRKSPPQAVVELDRPELLFEEGDDRFDRVRAVIRGALLELPVSSIYPGSSQERANQTQDVIFNLARLPNDGQPYSTATQERWISVEFRGLDGGLQYFLRKLFDNIVRPGQEPDVVLKSPAYIREGLVPFVNKAVPVHILNYMGFLVMVRLAPFLPGKKLDSRDLFAYSALGRSLPDVTDTSALCLLAVESLLPECIAKAAAIMRDRTDTDFGARDVLSRLKSLFGREIPRLAWLGELSSLFMRYNLRSSRVVQFGPRPGSCVWWQGNVKDPPLKRYFDISLMRQQEKLQAVLNFSAAAKLRAFESDLDTEVRYDPTRRQVHVPATIFTTSTRTNESFFAFQLPRVATRLYRAMVQMLTEEEPYSEQLQSLVAGLTENSTRALGSLLSCIERNMPNNLKTKTQEKTRAKAVLEQAVAVHLAFRAFREMLHVKRIWNLDYRLPGLPEVSSDQLFFVYFALDNCHSEDAVSHARLTSAAVDELRVGAPLRYLAEFSDAFQCGWQPACRIAY